jgi:uncharacterized membrane protein
LHWKLLGNGFDDQLPKVFTLSTLRPNTKYPSYVLKVIDTGTNPKSMNVALQNLVTLPSFTPASATTSNLQPTRATISWSTAFSGTSNSVVYGLQPPMWVQSSPAIATNDAYVGVVATGPYDAWAVTFGGAVTKKTITGWTPLTTPDQQGRQLRSIDSPQPTIGWAVGLASPSGPLLLHMTDGQNWSVMTPPSGLTTNLYDVYAADSRTAWITGEGQKVYFYDGSNWVDKSPSFAAASEAFYEIYSPDNLFIIGVGPGGALARSTDGGANWTKFTLPNNTIYSLTSIASVDGQTIWVGGRGGQLWKSPDRGVSWQQFTFITPGQDVWDVAMSDETHVWVAQERSIGVYDGTIYTSSPTVFATEASITNSISVINGADILAASGKHIYEYSVFGSVVPATNGATPSATLTGLSSNLPPGTQYNFAAFSVAGSMSGGAFGSFTLPQPDTVPPTVSFTNPTSTVYTKTAAFTALGNAADNTGLLTVDLTLNGASQALTTTPDLSTSPTTTSWTSTMTLVQGANTLTITATDTSGNTVTQSRTVYLDLTAPTVSITTPANASTQNIVPLTLSGTTTDDTGVVTMDYQLNGGGAISIPAPSSGNGAWTSTISAPRSGSNTVTVHAFDRAGNVASSTSTFTYAAPTFSMTATPSAATTSAIGQTLHYTISVRSQNSFAGNVTLSATSTPSGLNAVFTPATATVAANGTTSVSVDIATDTLSPGTYDITFAGASGALSASTSVSVTLTAAPDFTVSASANAPAPNIIAGQGGSYTISVSTNDTFTGTIAFSVSGAPSGVTPTFTPSSLAVAANASGTVQFQVATTSTTTPGNYTMTISATGSSVTHTATASLNIIAPPNFSITMSPSTQSVTAGDPATFYGGTLQSTNGFTGDVAVSVAVSGGRSDITAVVSRSTIHLDANSTGTFVVNIQADHSVPGGTYVATITGSTVIGGSTVTRTSTVNLNVAEDLTAPVISNVQSSPNYARVTITWVTDEPADGTITIYYDRAKTDLVGELTDPTPCTGQPCTHSITYPDLPPTPATYYYVVTSWDTSAHRNPSSVSQVNGQPLQFTTLEAPDTSVPTLTVTSPAASATPTSIIGQLTIAGSAIDNKAMSQVIISIRPQATGSTWTPISVPQNCSGAVCDFSYTWTTDRSVPNGLYTITVQGSDTAGNRSATITRTVDVANDFVAPQITAGPATVVSNPCNSSSCTAIITWSTDKPSTTEIEYNTTLPYCTANNADHCHVTADDRENGNASALRTEHRITLSGLEPNQIYHFRITSCNGNGVCTN